MPRIAEQSMERRMEIVWLYVKRHPNGVTEKEIADATGIGRKTVNNYLRQMKDEGKLEKDGRLWFIGDYEEVLSLKFEITPEVAYTYYLGSRLLVKQHDKRNELAESALMELADELAAHHLVGDEIAQAARELAQRPSDPGYEKIFQTMVSCYLKRKPVSITYKPLNGEPFDTVFKTYLIEPSAIGYATYVIGDSSLPKALRAYKLERIQAAEPVDERYKVPDAFPGLEILKNSWSIIIGEKTQRVELKFSTEVKERVRETQWHPSQDDDHKRDKTKNKDDPLLWWVDVADTTDMIPWIRSWGADVEVIEPVELRQQLIRETLDLIEVYGLRNAEGENNFMDVFQQYLTLPGKTEPPLSIFEHSSDVFHIALYLIEANRSVIKNIDLIKIGALLHDVGKIEQDLRKNKWIHQPHSNKYLQSMLEHPRLQQLLEDNEINLNNVSYDDLLLICEHHHDIPTRADLLRRCPDALLVSIADVIASSIEGGWLGSIREMLEKSPYIKLNTLLMSSLGLDGGLNSEIHRIDLPAHSAADALLCDLIYRHMSTELQSRQMTPLLQKNGSLWVICEHNALKKFLEVYTVNPQTLFDAANVDDGVFESLLTAPSMPSPGALEPSSMRFLLLNERIAQKMASNLALKKNTRKVIEHFDIPVATVEKMFGSTSLDDLNDIRKGN